MTVNEYLKIANLFSHSEKLRIIEELSKKVRLNYNSGNEKKKSLSDFFGIWSKNEAKQFEDSIKDCEKIDENEW